MGMHSIESIINLMDELKDQTRAYPKSNLIKYPSIPYGLDINQQLKITSYISLGHNIYVNGIIYNSHKPHIVSENKSIKNISLSQIQKETLYSNLSKNVLSNNEIINTLGKK
jgi:hypothetical protein